MTKEQPLCQKCGELVMAESDVVFPRGGGVEHLDCTQARSFMSGTSKAMSTGSEASSSEDLTPTPQPQAPTPDAAPPPGAKAEPGPASEDQDRRRSAPRKTRDTPRRRAR